MLSLCAFKTITNSPRLDIITTSIKMDLSNSEVKTSKEGAPFSRFDLAAKSGWHVELFDSVADLPGNWDSVGIPDLFIDQVYLRTLESFPPANMSFFYALVLQNGKAKGRCILQVHHFNAKESIRREAKNEKKSFGQRFADGMKNVVAAQVDFYGLVVGNLLVTGEHGFTFDSTIEAEEGQGIVQELIEGAIPEIQKKGKKIALVLVKDFFSTNRTQSQPFLSKNYSDFTVQPNMIFKLDPAWNTFEDYKAAMSSKYRVRCKRAYKKSASIVKRNLTVEEIEAATPRIFELYCNISDGAGFNLFKLNKDYFAGLKRNLKERFNLIGFYQDEKLLGFFTTIENNDDLEAHFLGFESQANREMQLYLTMLYDIIDIALKAGSKEIVFSRTAIEIKSSVGAVPYQMYTLMTHRNKLVNKYFAPTLVNYLSPKEEYTIRRPFKDKGN